MKKERILKILVVLILGMALILMSTNVFAVLSDSDGLTDYYDDKTNSLDSNTNTNTNTNTNLTTNTNVDDWHYELINKTEVKRHARKHNKLNR